MAKQSESSTSPTGLDELREELGVFLDSLTQRLMGKVSDKIGDLTDRLTDVAEGEGGLLAVGSRVLKGESPAKAMFTQKAKDIKDQVTGAVKNVIPGLGNEDGDGGKGGKIKVTNIVESVDVGVPVRTAYDQWAQFEDFSDFTKGVRSVDKEDETTSDWNVKVGPSSRSWKASIQEMVPDERIAWTSEGPRGTTRGGVSFHELAPNLTRILVYVEYAPAGFVEKTGNLWRAQGRRLRLDLKHFGRHITLNADDDIEGWRGEIRDGEVVRSHEEGLEDDEAAEDGYEEDEEDEDWDEETDEEAEEPEEPVEEEGQEPEQAEKRQRGSRNRRSRR
ncbi:Polyketide cyclase / dehydrase and lipid transport [Actinacidiphila yanglinensis]|uniref:Polyketide cyclase / dehydrase and lipid transport n=1 Tax=Actinacidiphila yanglinensis TaxID=310779 RepID=A0A1H6ECV0_9ACTN|nr:SRPBCC family protein [Actinacidiphila yanglinensis]SEG95628.1 Polyketide cyclase / dehydrase and lipid transport [Actinacidiphila yanglinensis]